jgi:hypothetical protein
VDETIWVVHVITDSTIVFTRNPVSTQTSYGRTTKPSYTARIGDASGLDYNMIALPKLSRYLKDTSYDQKQRSFPSGGRRVDVT